MYSFERVDLPYISKNMGGVITKIWYYVFDYTIDQQQQKDSDCDQEFGDADSFNTGVTQITDNINRYWHVADNRMAPNASVKPEGIAMQWDFWNWNSNKYVFGKMITSVDGTQITYYIRAEGNKLKLTTDGGTPTASTTDARVFERVNLSSGIETFKPLNSDLYAGLNKKKLRLLDDENATEWVISE